MKKRFIVAIALIILSVMPFMASGCGIARFMQYEYKAGIMLLLDGDGVNFYNEISFVTSYEMSEDEAEETYYSLYHQLEKKINFMHQPNDADYYTIKNLNGESTGQIIFRFYFDRAVLDTDTDYYRYDPNLIPLLKTQEENKFLYKNYSMQYKDPTWGNIYDLDISFFNNIVNMFPSIANNYRVLLACSRRDNVFDGQVVAIDGTYYAEFDKVSDTNVLNYGFSSMVGWAWYVLVIVITVIVVGLILALAQKGQGKFVENKPKPKRFVPFSPYANPYNNQQNPYGNNQQNPFGGQYNQNPYGNNQQNPFGSQYNQQNPYINPNQQNNQMQNPYNQGYYNRNGFSQNIQQNPLQQNQAKPVDVFPEFANQDNDKDNNNQNNNQ